jgi:hypothetical protein
MLSRKASMVAEFVIHPPENPESQTVHSRTQNSPLRIAELNFFRTPTLTTT